MTVGAIVVQDRGPVRWLRIDRPAALNAIDDHVVDGLDAALTDAVADQVRVLVLTGTGERAFCAGADIGGGNEDRADDGHRRDTAFLDRLGAVLTRLERFPAPVIAAVNGIAVGGGLELVLCCDLVVAADTARLGDGHANYGFVPGGGASVRLPRRVGIGRALQLMFTGELVAAPDLAGWGLLNEVVPAADLDAAVTRLADTVAAKSPLGLRRTKALVRDALSAPPEVGLARELLASELHRRSADNREGLAAFADRRTPRFTGQ